MSLQNLRSFIETFRCQSISTAARNLNLTQPAVSQHIMALEAQLDRKLFERKPRGVEPTAFARDLAAQVGDGLDRAEAALARMQARSSNLSGVVHIAGPAELMAEKIAPHLCKLAEAGVQARVRLGGRSSIYEALQAGDVDLAFTASRPDGPQLAGQRVSSEKLLAVAAPAMAARINAAADMSGALASEPFVAYDTDLPLVRDWCAQNDVTMAAQEPAVTAPDIRVLRALVEAGAGWSVIPDYLCARSMDAGTLHMLGSGARAPENEIFLVWTRSALRHPRIAFARDLLLDGV